METRDGTSRGLVLDVLRDMEIDTTGVDAGTRLREDLSIDSTELIELAITLERQAGVRVETDDILAARTVEDLVALVDAGARQEIRNG